MNKRIILILLGKRGAGKTSLAKLFVAKDGFQHIEMSQYLLALKEKLGLKEMVLRNFVEQFMREKGKTFFINQLCSDCINSGKSNIVLTGVRHLSEFDFLRNELQECQVCFVYLQVNFANRFFRILRRQERSSIWQFIVEEYYSNKWGDKKLQRVSINYPNEQSVEQALPDLRNIIYETK